MTQSIITRCAGIMAGGEGSRLSAPGGSKGLVEVAGIPLVEYVLKQFEVAEISHVLFAAHDRDNRLRQFIRDLSSSSRFESVDYVSSDARPGTGGAVRTI